MAELRFSDADLAALIPLPKSNANKYTRGTLNVVGGSAQYPGAAVLASRAGQRAGAGYTQVWCAPESVATVRAGGPSLVVRAWDEQALDQALRKAENSAEHPMAVLIGCGFSGEDPCELQLLRTVLARKVSVVVDAGALSGLARLMASEGSDFLHARAASGAGTPLILTPHAGEASRLMGALNRDCIGSWQNANQDEQENVERDGRQEGRRSASWESRAEVCGEASTGAIREVSAGACREVSAGACREVSAGACRESQADIAQQIVAAHLLADAYAATVVLKGPETVVAHGSDTYLMDKGTPALAKAGTGDVLAGIIAALLAQGLSPVQAAVLGTRLHADAGNEAARRLGVVSVIPEDVIDCIPVSIQELLAHR